METIPEDPAERRRCALDLFEKLPTADVLSALVRHATGFMRMVKDIDRFCLSVGATVGGRIQIQTEGPLLQFSGLSSGWMFAGPSDWESSEQRALALAEELRYLTAEFDPDRATGYRERLTSFGRSLRGTIYADLGLSGTTRDETTVSQARFDELRRSFGEVETARISS